MKPLLPNRGHGVGLNGGTYMNPDLAVLGPEERLILTLRGLYERYGYRQYKMNRFEEYRLYMENKNFLVSESVIAFTDLDGRLLALKPDVTLSIVRHTKEAEEQRVYYIENVYRPDKAKRNFREIAQMGLERIGCIDAYAISETTLLAAQSLYAVSENSLLEISHMGFVTGLIHALGIPEELTSELMRLIGEKNTHGIRLLGNNAGLETQDTERLAAVPSLCGDLCEVLQRAEALCVSDEMRDAVGQLSRLAAVLSKTPGLCRIRLDLSLLGEEDYYNGIIFGGYIDGLPTRVLSGGQYDRVMRKFGKSGGAIGFALYLSEMELLFSEMHQNDCDLKVIYDPSCDMDCLFSYICTQRKDGKRVYACPVGAESRIRAAKTVCFGEYGIKEEKSC